MKGIYMPAKKKTERIVSKVKKKKEDEKKTEEALKKKTAEKEAVEEAPKKFTTAHIVVIVVVLGMLVFSYGLKTTYDSKLALEQCASIQNDPELLYPCVCFPITQAEAETMDHYETLEGKIQNNVCRCDCDIGNNRTWTAYIPRAK